MPTTITRISPADNVADFCCGTHALDSYLHRHAVRNDRAGINCAYVLRRGENDTKTLPEILGFYTLSMASVEPSWLSDQYDFKLPKYPLPVVLIGRLAIDQRAQRMRFGRHLLINAIETVLIVAESVGCIGTAVDAKNTASAEFYGKYGFFPLGAENVWPQQMYLSNSTARIALSGIHKKDHRC